MQKGLALAVAATLVAAFAGMAAGPAEAAPAAPRLPGDLGWYSTNWAGYAVDGGPYSSVSGQWTVPAVRAGRRAGFSALWVGLDGLARGPLIQAGTEADFYGGAAHYSAWWEILPAPAVTIRTLSVRPGDRISVTIARASAGRWRVTVTDARSGSYTTTRPYAGPAASAEWIEEAPVVGGRATALPAHGTVVFDNAALDGAGPNLILDDAGAMIRRGVQVDTPSAPDRDGNGFALAEQAVAPAPPGS